MGRRRILMVASAACLSLVLAACGTDEQDEAPEDAAASEEPEGSEDDSEASQDVAFEGETVRIVVGYSAGGGYDTYARTIAAHLGDHIPGNPNVIVENMPGAGSLVAANQVFNSLPSDGTVIGSFNGGLLLQQLLGNPAAQFEASEFHYLGAPAAETITCVGRSDTGVTSLSELRDRGEPLTFGGLGAGSQPDDVATVLRDFLDLEINLVTGYPGTSDLGVAMEQGESDAGCWGWESQRVILEANLSDGSLIPLGQAAREPHPDTPDVELFDALVRDESDQQVIDGAIFGPSQFARPFTLHPDTDPAIVAVLQQAFQDTLVDEAFLARAAEANLAISPISVEEFLDAVGAVEELDDDLRAELGEALIPDA